MVPELATVSFALSGVRAGQPISPANIDLPSLRDFLEEIETLLKGSNRALSLANSTVTFSDGSLKAYVAVVSTLLTSFFADVEKLASSGDLNLIDPKRAGVFDSWQERARKLGSAYTVGAGSYGTLNIRPSSDFTFKRADVWYSVVTYLNGEVQSLGGKLTPNLHLAVKGISKDLIISITKEQTLELNENPVYRSLRVKVKAKKNLRTGELSDLELIEIVRNPSLLSEAEWEKLLSRGRVAWEGVESPSAWVEQLRGRNE